MQTRGIYCYNGKNMKALIILFTLAAALFGSYFFLVPLLQNGSDAVIASFQECADAGNPIMESYPRGCRTPDGKLFVEDIGGSASLTTGNILEKAGLIRLDSPQPGAVIASPLTVKGEARGTWFFEASFPLVLVDWDGKIIAESFAQAKDEWMTEEFVPFLGTLVFEKPASAKASADRPAYGVRGVLILKKDNPSGLPEHDDALEIPIMFTDEPQQPASAKASADKPASAKASADKPASSENEAVRTATLETNRGAIQISFFPALAPKTVENFLSLARAGFYDGTKFHRVIKGFMIQGGDPLTKDDAKKAAWGTGGPGYAFADEIHAENRNLAGTIAMANSGPNTNGSQFFINAADNTFLDGKHTVFGKVIAGMEIVRAIENTPTDSADRPLQSVVIERISVK